MAQNTEKYTVITGASSGIGYETAKAFAGRGSNLILTARRKERLEALRQEILCQCIYRGISMGIKGTWMQNAGKSISSRSNKDRVWKNR